MSKINGWKRVEQWVSRVIEYSSEDHREFWTAKQIIGPTKVYPQYGKLAGVWAQGDISDNEFIVVEYPTFVFPDEIQIYETFNSGGLVKISIRKSFADETTAWKIVWQSDAPILDVRARIFVVRNDEILSSREINQIRLDVNCRAACDACHIDSVKLIGYFSQHSTSIGEIQLNLNEMFFQQNFFPDVSFELADGKRICSSRKFLSARSIYFRQLFEENRSTIDKSIRLDRISSRSFEEILRFLFTKTIDRNIDFQTSIELLRRVDEFHLSEIYPIVLKILRKRINVKNVFSLMIFAAFPPNDDEIRLDDLLKICQKFIRKNRQNVFQFEHFQQIDKTIFVDFLLLLTSDEK